MKYITKIKYKDYKGKFFIDERVVESDEFEEWLYQQILDGENYPDFVWGVKKELAFNIDIKEIVNDACEDGYEDMSENLDFDSLKPIQEQIDKWVVEQGDCIYNFFEDYSIWVELDELIEEILEQIEKIVMFDRVKRLNFVNGLSDDELVHLINSNCLQYPNICPFKDGCNRYEQDNCEDRLRAYFEASSFGGKGLVHRDLGI
jgi:hypothetical protein